MSDTEKSDDKASFKKENKNSLPNLIRFITKNVADIHLIDCIIITTIINILPGSIPLLL